MSAVILLAVMGITAGAALRYFHLHLKEQRAGHQVILAQGVAESGLEKAVAMLRVNPAYTGEENTPLGEGRFTVSVAPGKAEGNFRLRATATWGDASAHPRPASLNAWLRLDAAGKVLDYGLVEERR